MALDAGESDGPGAAVIATEDVGVDDNQSSGHGLRPQKLPGLSNFAPIIRSCWLGLSWAQFTIRAIVSEPFLRRKCTVRPVRSGWSERMAQPWALTIKVS